MWAASAPRLESSYRPGIFSIDASHDLHVAGVMPAEPARLAGIYICSHGPRPVRPAYAGEPAHHGVHDVWKPVAALQCIAAVARGPRHLGQLAPCLAMYRGQVVSIARHLGGLREPSSD